MKFLAERGIEFTPVPDLQPVARSWYDGCGCGEEHWKDTTQDSAGHSLRES